MKRRFAIALSLSLYLASPLHAKPAANDLLAYENNTIEIFEKYSAKVVYVHRLTTVINRSYERMEVPAGAGSGIIWDKKGHIVTNFHVVDGADNLAVSIGNVTVPAKVMGAEPRKDLAVLAIRDPKALAMLQKFKPFVLADSNHLQVGQKVIAIGNPFGLDHSLTVGVISALGRRVPGVAGVAIRDMIQTDASINPGNSGGPLLDSKGRLLGVNTAIFSNSGSSAGVGFAVPAEDIGRIVPQLIQNGRVQLAGIGVLRVEPSIARRLGVNHGILVAEVLPNSPAAKAGIRGTHRDGWGRVIPGDIIVAMNGSKVHTYDDFYNMLTKIPVGKEVALTLERDGQKLQRPMKTIDISGS